jgi:CPA2 family monovalent cation:H+ antiporter-2
MVASLDPILADLAVLFGTCVAVVVVFHRLRVPPIVGFLLTGAAIGPNALGFVRNVAVVEQLAEVGVVILLFTVGMELPLRRLMALRREFLLGGAIQIAGTVLLGAVVAAAAGAPAASATFLGVLLAMSSTAVVTRLLTDRGEVASPVGRLAMPILVAQDLAIVPVILLLPLLAGRGGAWLAALTSTASAVGLLAVTVAAACFLTPRVLDVVSRTRSREAFVMTVMTLCLLMAIATGQMGLSLALGAFLAGVVLAESEYHHQAMGEVEPFRDALSSLFFVSIGTLFDYRVIVEQPAVAALSLAAVVFGKTAVVCLAGRALGKPTWLSLRTGLLIAQVGEFSFVLVQIAGRDLLPERLREIFLVVAVLSIAATPLLFALARRIGHLDVRGMRKDPGHGVDLRGHVIIVGYGPTGHAVGSSLRALRMPFIAIEMNAATVKAHRERGVRIFVGDSTRPVVLHAAGIGRARLLVLAINDADATRRTAALAKQLAPRVQILARAAYLGEVAPLRRIGVQDVVPQELETSVEMIARVLRHYLVPDDEVRRQVHRVRTHAMGTQRSAPEPEVQALQLETVIAGVAVEVCKVGRGSAAEGKTLAELELRRRSGASVVCVKRGDEHIINVGPELRLEAGDVVVLLGPRDRLRDGALQLRAPDEEPAVPLAQQEGQMA